MLVIARALVVPSRIITHDGPFGGLAPAIVKEIMDALMSPRGKVAMIIVEHHGETMISIVHRTYVLVNGQRHKAPSGRWNRTRPCGSGCWGWWMPRWWGDRCARLASVPHPRIRLRYAGRGATSPRTRHRR